MALPRALSGNIGIVAGMLAAVAIAAAFSAGLLPGALRTQILPPPPGGADLGACCADPGAGQSCVGNVTFDQCDAMTEPDGFFLGYGSGNPAAINEQCSIACGRDQGGGGGGVSSSSSSSSASSSGGADLQITISCVCGQTGTIVCTPSVKNIGPDAATGIGVELDISGNLQITSATALQGGTAIPIQSQISNQVIWQPSAGPLAKDAVTSGTVALVSGGQTGGGSVSLVLVASAPQDGNTANNTDIANVNPADCVTESSSSSSDSSQSSSSSEGSSSSSSSAQSSSSSSSAESSSASSQSSSSSSSRSRSPLCGNHELDAGEECDDGNILDGDGCTSFCEVGSEYCSLQ